MESSLVALAVAAVAVAIAAYTYWIREWNVFKRHRVPYVKPLPFGAASLLMIFKRVSFAEVCGNLYQVYPGAKYIGAFDMSSEVVVLRDPELIKTVVVKNFDRFPEHRGFVVDDLDPLFSKNLFSLTGDRWKEVRTLSTPVFTSSKIKAMFKLMVSVGESFVNSLADWPEAEKGIDIKDAVTRYTNDVIASCAFGFEINSMEDRNNPFYIYGKDAMNFGGKRGLVFMLARVSPTFCRWFGVKFIAKEVEDFFLQVVSDTIKEREEKGIFRPDIIQQLIENREKVNLSTMDMTALAFSFFLGGFDSTATTMSFAAQEVAYHPHVHRKLQEEVDAVLEETNGDITYEVLNNMKYLDAVVNETLRMYPIAVMTDRRCTEEYELPPAVPGAEPFVIKPGSCVWVPIFGMQRDPAYFKEPNTFNPDRFVEDPKLINCGLYMPFGLGPRMCIGNRFALLEVKVMLFFLMAFCDLQPCAKSTIPTAVSKSSIMMTAEGGFWLSVKRRSNPHSSLAARANK